MELPKSFVVLGAGGMGVLLYWLVRDILPDFEVCFIEDESDRRELDLGDKVVPVWKTWDMHQIRKTSRFGPEEGFTQFTLAVSDPEYKRRFVPKALAVGLTPMPTIIHPSSHVHGVKHLGAGGIFSSGTVVQAFSEIGDYVTLAEHSSVAHHCKVGKYASLSTGSLLLGNVELGEGVWLGGGTAVRDRIRIAPWVKTGIQSAVVNSIEEEGITVVGVPARRLVKSAG